MNQTEAELLPLLVLEFLVTYSVCMLTSCERSVSLYFLIPMDCFRGAILILGNFVLIKSSWPSRNGEKDNHEC